MEDKYDWKFSETVVSKWLEQGSSEETQRKKFQGRMTLNEEHTGRKDGKDWHWESVRTEKRGKDSNFKASKAVKRERTGETRNDG